MNERIWRLVIYVVLAFLPAPTANAAQTPKAVSPLAHLSLSDLAVFIRLPPLLTVLEKEKKSC